MFKAFLIKYAEIGLKGKNRYLFENALRDKIAGVLKPLGDIWLLKNRAGYFLNVQKTMIMKRRLMHFRGYLEYHLFVR